MSLCQCIFARTFRRVLFLAAVATGLATPSPGDFVRRNAFKVLAACHLCLARTRCPIQMSISRPPYAPSVRQSTTTNQPPTVPPSHCMVQQSLCSTVNTPSRLVS